uniref:Uncharacterized protein n=1 Tax=Solanum lycopersicum TaxID=4081 RepID=A0A3Q7I0E6_SOLLC
MSNMLVQVKSACQVVSYEQQDERLTVAKTTYDAFVAESSCTKSSSFKRKKNRKKNEEERKRLERDPLRKGRSQIQKRKKQYFQDKRQEQNEVLQLPSSRAFYSLGIHRPLELRSRSICGENKVRLEVKGIDPWKVDLHGNLLSECDSSFPMRLIAIRLFRKWQKFLCSDGLHFFVTLERQLKCLGMKVVLEYLAFNLSIF